MQIIIPTIVTASYQLKSWIIEANEIQGPYDVARFYVSILISTVIRAITI